MHNKSMTFDNQVTIVGGRNIGDQYFAAREESNYDDLDVLAVGPAVREVSASFDDYWNSAFAIPAEAAILESNLSFNDARLQLLKLYDDAMKTQYGAGLSQGIREAVHSGRFKLSWVPVKVFADPPEKAGGATDVVLAADILPVLKSAKSELVVASAYFVPGPEGVKLLSGFAKRGVHVLILTNSLDSNDVEPVHGHYARYRKALLEAGIELWELRADHDRPGSSLLEVGQSRSGLHSKAFVVDGRQFFIGSFNWDPRSVWINTEMGMLIDSPAIAGDTVHRLKANLQNAAYRLRLSTDGQIEWMARRDDGSWAVYEEEPSSSPWRKLRSKVYGVLPIGDQM